MDNSSWTGYANSLKPGEVSVLLTSEDHGVKMTIKNNGQVIDAKAFRIYSIAFIGLRNLGQKKLEEQD